MVKCTFCGEELLPGTGMMYVKKDAKVLYFCSRKCETNMLKRRKKARTTKWTKEYVKGEG